MSPGRNPSARRAAPVNVGLARGYLHELRVKSRQGIEAAAVQGRHAGGKALYGHRFREIPHPNPHKARQGHKQKILDPDPVRAPIVQMIFEDYVARGMSLGDLQAKLNADLELPAAGVTGSSTTDWQMGSLERMGDPAQPQVHQLPGVEPAGAETRRQDESA
jgi:hypothetical protein